MIYSSLDDVCFKITQDMVTEETHLSSNQEEANTKLLLHAKHVLHENQNQNVVLWSLSGDIDINILCFAMFPLQAERMWVDYETGDHRHILKLNSINMDDEKKLALLGFHATTGNDYVPSFFQLGKEKSWKIVEKYSRFTTMFASLGNSRESSEEDLKFLKEFVFVIYKEKKANR